MTNFMVASGGGHLQELLSLTPRFSLTGPTSWATPQSGLSEDLLRGLEYYELPYHRPRDWRGAASLLGPAMRILRSCGATRVISTGSLPAVPFFLAGAMLRLDLHYIESATRSLGPSLTGKLASMIPGTNLYTQYASQASRRWNFAGSVFDPYRVELSTSVAASVSRVVVTLGTEAYPFSRAVMQLLKVLPSTAEVLWQTGSTDVSGLGIVGHRRIPANALRTAMAEADVIVSHAGVGSSITAMDLGKVPVLLPREGRHGEHVDDHQLQVARELSRRGLAQVARVEELSEEHLASAMSRTVVRDEVLVPFPMVGVNPNTGVSPAQPVPIQPLSQR